MDKNIICCANCNEKNCDVCELDNSKEKRLSHFEPREEKEGDDKNASNRSYI